MGRLPTQSEFEILLARETDDEILFREALRLGIETRDQVVRQRLLMNMRFLQPESINNEEQLLAAATAMHMHRKDLVIRRRLIQVMRMMLAAPADQESPSARELADLLVELQEQFTTPRRISFSHVFFSSDLRAGKETVDALAVRSILQSKKSDAKVALNQGDPFLTGYEFSLLTENQVSAYFGRAFAHEIFQLQPGLWSQPVDSAYGIHLVLPLEIRAAEAPVAESPEVRKKLLLEWRRRQADALLEEELAVLRVKYGVQT